MMMHVFFAMHGKKIFSDVLEPTNAKALKLKSGDIMFRRYYPLALSDIFEFFAHLVVFCCVKNRQNDDVRKFLSSLAISKLRTYQHFYG